MGKTAELSIDTVAFINFLFTEDAVPDTMYDLNELLNDGTLNKYVIECFGLDGEEDNLPDTIEQLTRDLENVESTDNVIQWVIGHSHEG